MGPVTGSADCEGGQDVRTSATGSGGNMYFAGLKVGDSDADCKAIAH